MSHQLEVAGLNLSFGGLRALVDVNLHVDAGELVAVIGPNGAGKTSLINCINGFYRPQAGTITFEGYNITRQPPHVIAGRGIARAFQNVELFRGMTVLENLTLARHLHLRYGVAHALAYYGRAQAEEAANRRFVEEILDFMELEPYRQLPRGSRDRRPRPAGNRAPPHLQPAAGMGGADAPDPGQDGRLHLAQA